MVNMPAPKPLWRRGVEAVDKVAAPVLEGATRHEGFGRGLSVLQQTRRAVYRRTERMSRQILHGLNLPTASDVNRLLSQIAAVENRVRQLDKHVEEHLPLGSDAAAPQAPSSRQEPRTTPKTSPNSRKNGPAR